MSEVKDDYQQQVLFDEIDVSDNTDNLPATQEQVIFENESWQEDEHGVLENEARPEEQSSPNWLLRSTIGLFVVLVIVEAVEFFTLGLTQSPIVASLYAALLGCIGVMVGTTAYKEFSTLRQFKKQLHYREEAEKIKTGDSKISAAVLCEQISQNLPCDIAEEHQEQWQTLDKDAYGDEEVIKLYSRKVLSQVDEKALNEVATFSTEATVLVGLSPIAIADMLLMFWRNLRMVNKIAGLYGVKLGYFSRIKLIKQVFVNMAYAGASELVTDLGANLLGAELLGKLSGKLAQGLGAGMLTARLGIKTIALCRPLAFEEQQPKLNDIRKRVVSQVKSLINKPS